MSQETSEHKFQIFYYNCHSQDNNHIIFSTLIFKVIKTLDASPIKFGSTGAAEQYLKPHCLMKLKNFKLFRLAWHSYHAIFHSCIHQSWSSVGASVYSWWLHGKSLGVGERSSWTWYRKHRQLSSRLICGPPTGSRDRFTLILY